jgi:hypothetical protein
VNKADLPPNTKVTITGDNSQSRTYTWDGDKFTVVGTPPTEFLTSPNKIPAGGTISYGVEVDLPLDTKLSPDIEKGFPVPITAFIDDETPGLQGTEPKNITIDRVYTGFLKLVKESRVLVGTGTAPRPEDVDFSDKEKLPTTGNIIEYRIRYKNISEAQAGTGNVILNADKVVIVDDGTTKEKGGSNNWALDNDNNGQIDTSNIVGSAKDSGAAVIQFYSGNPTNNGAIDQTGTSVDNDVTKYVDTVKDKVAPQEERTFSFQRKVN